MNCASSPNLPPESVVVSTAEDTRNDQPIARRAAWVADYYPVDSVEPVPASAF